MNTDLRIDIRVANADALKQLRAMGRQITQLQKKANEFAPAAARMTTGLNSVSSAALRAATSLTQMNSAGAGSGAVARALARLGPAAVKAATSNAALGQSFRQINANIQATWGQTQKLDGVQKRQLSTTRSSVLAHKALNASYRAVGESVTNMSRLVRGAGNLTSRALTPALSAAGLAAGGLRSSLGGAGRSMISAGRDAQWLGRQIEFRLSFPLIAAGVAATSFFLGFDENMTRLRKVYGGATEDTAQFEQQFIDMSNTLGIASADIAGIGAAWAQAGAEGEALSMLTFETARASALTNSSLEETQQQLLQIIGGYELTAGELAEVVNMFNAFENDTPANFSDLAEVVRLTGSTARQAGVPIQDLAAITTQMVNRFGTASEVGRSFNSIIAKVMAPTNEAAEAIRAMGIEISDADFQASNFTERMSLLAQAQENLADSTRFVLNENVAQVRQLNRFFGALTAVESEILSAVQTTGAYTDANENAARALDELAKQLSSPSGQVQVLKTQLQNLAIEGIRPLIPIIIAVMRSIVGLAQRFSELSPAAQKAAALGALFVAAIGPVMGLLGSFGILLGTVASTLAFFGRALIAPIGGMIAFGRALLAMSGPQLLAVVVGIGVIIAAFQNFERIRQVVADGINKLPAAFSGALSNLLSVVSGYVQAIWNWLKRLNPFQRFSPSLVDNVKAGVKVIGDEYGKLVGIASSLRPVTRSMQDFGRVVGKLRSEAAATAFLADRELVQEIRPSTIASFEEATQAILDLRAAASGLRAEIADQQISVDLAASALAAANGRLEQAEARMEGLQSRAQQLTDAISASRSEISRLAGMKITGMTAQEDAMFATSMAIKGQQLRLAQLELAYLQAGDAAAGLRSQQSALGAEISAAEGSLEAMQSTLDGMDAAVDAASNALSTLEAEASSIESAIDDARRAIDDLTGMNLTGEAAIDDQLFSLEQERKAAELELKRLEAAFGSAGDAPDHVAARMSELEAVMSDLDLRSDIIELEADLEFEPLRREIERLANPIEELSFGDIASGIVAQQAAVQEYEAQLASVNARISDQQTIVENLEAARDAYQVGLDAESARIDAMRDQYDALGDAITSAEQARTDSLASIQREIDLLSKMNEIAQIQFDLEFDPQQRAIERAANPVEEMSSGAIIAGIQAEQANIAALEPELAQVNAEIAAQQQVIDELTAARDGAQEVYDAEVAALDNLQAELGEVELALQTAETEMSDFISMLEELKQATEAAAGSGGGGVGPLDLPGENFAPIEDLEQLTGEFDLEAELAKIQDASADLITGVSLKDWFNDQFGPVIDFIDDVTQPLQDLWAALDLSNVDLSGVESTLSPFINFLSGVGTAVLNFILGLNFQPIVDQAVSVFRKFVEVFDSFDIGAGLGNVARFLTPIVNFIIQEGAKILGAIGRVVAGIIGIVGNILEGDWKGAWDQFKSIVGDAVFLVLTFLAPARILGAIRLLGPAIFRGLKALGPVAVQALKGLGTLFLRAFNATKTTVSKKSFWVSIINGLKKGWNAAIDWLRTVALPKATTFFTNIGKWIWNNKGSIWGRIGDAAKFAWDSLKIAWSLQWAAFKNTILDLGLWIWANKNLLFNRLKDVLDDAFGGLKAAWPGLWTEVKSLLLGIGEWIVTKSDDLFMKLFVGLDDAIRKVITEMPSFIVSIGEALMGIGTWIFDNTQALVVQPLLDAVGAAFDAVLGVIPDWVRDKIGLPTDSEMEAWMTTAGETGSDALHRELTRAPTSAELTDMGISASSAGRHAARTMRTAAQDELNGLGHPTMIIDVAADTSAFWTEINGIDVHRSGAGGIGTAIAHQKAADAAAKVTSGKYNLDGSPDNNGYPFDSLARGGLMGLTGGPTLIGEGRRKYPEYVIPTDPMFRNNAVALMNSAMNDLGMARQAARGLQSGVAASAPHSFTQNDGTLAAGTTENHFHGDLVFPNVSNEQDAESFIRALEAV